MVEPFCAIYIQQTGSTRNWQNIANAIRGLGFSGKAMALVEKVSNKMSDLKTRLAQGGALGQALSTLMTRTAAAGLAYVFQVYLANTLKIDAYGIFVSFWTWQIILSRVAVLGYQESAVRFLPRYHKRNQEQFVMSFFRHGAKVVLGASGLIALVGAGTIWLFGDQIAAAYYVPALVLAFGLPIIALEIYLEGVARGLGWYFLSIVPTFVLRPLIVILLMLAMNQTGFQFDAGSTLAVMVGVSVVLMAGQTLIMVLKMKPKSLLRSPTRHWRLRKTWFFATIPLVIVSGIDEVLYWSDIVLLGFLTEPADVSVYFAAVRCMAFASFIHYGFMMVFAREFSLANAKGNIEELRDRITMASSWTFWLTIPTVLMIIAAGPILLSFFGEAFADGITVMVIIGVGAIGKSTVGIAPNLLIVLGKEKRDVIISGFSLVANIVLSIVLVPMFGIVGAAIGTATSQIVRAILLAYYCRTALDLDVTTDWNPRSLLKTKVA